MALLTTRQSYFFREAHSVMGSPFRVWLLDFLPFFVLYRMEGMENGTYFYLSLWSC